MTQAEKERMEQHVMAARSAGVGLARYARENGLSTDEIYTANKRLRSRGVAAASTASGAENTIRHGQPTSKESLPAFIPIEVTPATPSSIKVTLPNGIELQLGGVETKALPSLLTTLISVQCSR